ncbi:MAG: TolC family protein [Saprospiraceae bacterium]|nr:TolC family protein [Saprospiraceae bacterium]
MNRLLFILFIFVVSPNTKVLAQEMIRASIQDIIITAQAESPSYLLAKTKQNNAYWIYVASKSIFKPQLGFSATLPSINRSISPFTLPDGSRTFVTSSFISNSVGINLSQIVSATGGSIFVSTDLQRLDDLSNGSSTRYLSSPVSIGFDQPLLRLNPYKWDRQEAEINYTASKKRYVEDRERIAFESINNFFDLYISKLNLQEAIRNSDYLDSLAINAEGRFSVGRISETELLQIQLSAKNAKGTVAQLNLSVQNKIEALRDFLGIQKQVDFDLDTPQPITIFTIDKDKALEYALKNRSITEDFRLRLLNAERQMESARKENGPNLRLTGSFGLTQTSEDFTGAYQSLLDQERLSLSIDIPIADFGRSKAQREIAKSNLELTQLQLRQDQVSFEREILVNVEQFKLKRNQLQLAEEALEIALKRIDIAKKRFNIGKIDVTNLNIAIQEELSARQAYYATLWDLWRAHYTIRNLTLYDFEAGVPLE